MATTITDQNPYIARIARINAVCERLEEINGGLYEDMNQYADGDPAGYEALNAEVLALGFFLEYDDSPYGNASRIQSELQRVFVGIEKTVTVGIAPRVDVILCVNEDDLVLYADVLDSTDFLRPVRTRLTEDEIAMVITTYDLDLRP